MTARLSCYVLTLNSERRLAEVLSPLRDIADDLLVVDSGSSDRTLDIARSFGARVAFRAFDNFRDQRLFAERECAHDWILQIDSDEVVSAELAQEIRTLKDADFNASQTPAPSG